MPLMSAQVNELNSAVEYPKFKNTSPNETDISTAYKSSSLLFVRESEHENKGFGKTNLC